MIGRRSFVGAISAMYMLRALEAEAQDAPEADRPLTLGDVGQRKQIVLASDRLSIAGPGPNAALAASRCQVDGHRSLVAAGSNMQCIGLFDNAMIANRYCITGGQRTFVVGSTACRIFGARGVVDKGGLFDRSPGTILFDRELPNSTLRPGDETWSAIVLGSTAVDVTNGTNVFVGASRGRYSGGGGRLKVDRSGRIEGAANAVLATTDFDIVGRENVGSVASADVAIRRTASRVFVGGSRRARIERGSQASVLGTDGAVISGVAVATLASTSVEVQATNAAVICSRNVRNQSKHSIAGGHALLGAPHVANQSWRLESESGVFRGSQVACEGQGFGLMWENAEALKIPDASIVIREKGRRVRLARNGDVHSRIVGIASSDCSLVGNMSDFHWHNRHSKDAEGRFVIKSIPMVQWNEYDGPVDKAPKIPADATHYKADIRVENGDWDPSRPYTARESRRSEWTPVAMAGVALAKVYGPVDEDDQLGPDGKASDQPSILTVIEVRRPFDANDGFGLAYVLIR